MIHVNNGDFSKKINTPGAMQKFGENLAKTCKPGSVIYLQGNLGAGKTTLTRGFLRHAGYTGHVRSPTFTIVEPYEINKDLIIYHFDLYRLTDPEEFIYIGGHDYFNSQSICLIEWPEHGKKFLPDANLICNIEFDPTGKGRIVHVSL